MRNVVIVVLDTVRKDYFDRYATRLQERADVSFERAYAPSTWSIPSHASMFAGTTPHRHGVHSYNPDYATLGGTFLDDLDHTTIGVSGNGAVSEVFGFDTLFDEFVSFAANDERSPDALSFKQVQEYDGPTRYREYLSQAASEGVFVESLRNGLYIKANDFLRNKPLPQIGDSGADAIIEKSCALTRGQEPFVLFTNFIDAHGPMANCRALDSDVPYEWHSRQIDTERIREGDPSDFESYLENYRDLYRANVEYLDRKVSAWIDRLQAQTERETVFVITADHGEELGHSGERDLGHMDVSNALLHVPLLVTGVDESDTESAPVSLLDLGAIVTALATGGSVPDVSRDRVPAERLGMLFYSDEDPYWTRAVRTVIEDEHRYEWDQTGKSVRIQIDKSSDESSEEVEIPASITELFDEPLADTLADARGDRSGPDIDSGTEEQLETLGYFV